MLPRVRRDSTKAVHLFALSAFAIGQPLLDLLSRNAAFLLAHRATPFDVAAMVAVLFLAPPGLAWASIAATSALHSRAGRALQLIWVAAFVGAAILAPLQRAWDLPGLLLVAGAAGAGVGTAFLYARLRAVRVFATVLAVGPLVYVGSFLASDAIQKLLFPPDLPEIEVEIRSETPVVLVVFDALPTTSLLDAEGEIDSRRYPTFADLARRATWYRNASAVHSLTEDAVPSILSGRYPETGHLPILADHPHNLFTLLAGTYELNVVETLTALDPSRRNRSIGLDEDPIERFRALLSDLNILYLHSLLPRSLATGLPPIAHVWAHYAKMADDDFKEAIQRRPKLFREFTASIEGTPGPALHFIHILLPHYPWEFLPSGKSYYPRDDIVSQSDRWGTEEWWVAMAYQQHLFQLRFTDALLGELLAQLENEGLFDRSLFIVTADHGAGFWPGDSQRRPGEMEHPEDVLAVPLFIKLPFQREGEASLENAESVDILPTIADVLDVAIPWAVDGCSLVDASCPERDHKVIYSRRGESLRFAADPPLRQASLERKLSLQGPRTDGERLIAIGPYRHLVGRPQAELDVGPAREDVRAFLMRKPFNLTIAAPERFTPARISGILLPEAGIERMEIAMVVRGRVAMVAPALPHTGEGLLLSAFLPEHLRPDRASDVTLFAIEGPGESPRLRPIPTEVADITRAEPAVSRR
jgi:hypothetical protein